MKKRIITPREVKGEIDPWQVLADAVILQAVRDYRVLNRMIKRIRWSMKRRHYSPEERQYQFHRIEYYTKEQDKAGDFFFSDLFATLTDLDGYDLLDRLNKEAK